MIHVEICQDVQGNITSFTMSGHAEFAEKGQDIVCAGASAVAFGSLNAVISLTGVTPDIEQTDSGFLSCTIPSGLPAEASERMQLLLQGMIVSLQTIENEYGEYINIIFTNRG
ncbi:ribosomal-processing cysteine protease Prp [Siminovitchia sediminis]|uniref:Ribosomal processing cysteine protease Prp n=1 Tax=Siminovitchia sediminis TaxID=1274353 RepID=A0ABW4KHB4_9BACI